jgi:hypothetical protein
MNLTAHAHKSHDRHVVDKPRPLRYLDVGDQKDG